MSVIAESILIGVCIGVAIISAILIILSEIKEMLEVKHLPKVETYATVVSKRKRNRIRKDDKYFVEYKTDDGQNFECHVEEEVFNRLRAGDMGIISYKGMKYLGFRKAC